MSGCSHRRKQITCNRVIGLSAPHCDTCCCPCDYRETVCEIDSCPFCSCEATTEIFEPISGNCVCDCHCLHLKTPFSTPRTENWDTYLACTNRTYTILKRWFKRFDLNGDGCLDFYELKKLIHELGPGSLQNTQMECLFREVDCDQDGKLSFVEYLRMWQEAALHENEFLNVTNCHDLNIIIREYDLFPEEKSAHSFDLKFTRSSKLANNSLYGPPEVEPTICDCGYQEKVQLFVDPNRHNKILGFDEEHQIDEDLPVLSKNRSPVRSPKFNPENH